MQPVLIVASDVPGMICLNGRMACEVGAGREPAIPVCAWGAVIVEHRPFGGEHLPLCARLTFSGGELLPACLENARGLSAAGWPGGVTELQMRPARAAGPEETALTEGLELRLRAGTLSCRSGAGCAAWEAPPGAQMPAVARLPGAVVLTGVCDGGQYAVVLDEACRRVLFSDRAREAALTPEGSLRLLRALDEMPGHARWETWLPGVNMDAPRAVEPAFLDGAARTPASPEEVALTALRCAQLGEMEAAARCFHPASPCRDALAAAAAWDGALSLRCAPPDGRPRVGLVRALGENMIRVTPAAYRCAPGGAYGWQIEEMEVVPREETLHQIPVAKIGETW